MSRPRRCEGLSVFAFLNHIQYQDSTYKATPIIQQLNDEHKFLALQRIRRILPGVYLTVLKTPQHELAWNLKENLGRPVPVRLPQANARPS